MFLVATEEPKLGTSVGASGPDRRRNFVLRDAPKDELEEIHKLLDQGLSSKVDPRLRALIKSARANPSLIAKARCALSRSLEMQGRYRESLEAVAIYETPESRIGLNLEAASGIRVQIGLAYNYTGDH